MKDAIIEVTKESESWDEWSKSIMRVTNEVCGVSRGGQKQKSTWWWNEQVKEAVQKKRLLYKRWQKNKNPKSKEKYLNNKREVRRVVAAAKETEGKKITEQLDKNKSEAMKYIFRMARQSKKDKKDVVGMPCVRGTDGKLVLTLKDKIKVWKEYEEILLNEENEWSNDLKMAKVEGPCENVSVEAVMEALNLMNAKKAAGPSGVTSDLLKVCEKESVNKLVRVANDMLEGKKMPESWRKSDLIPIYKGKGDVRSCGNYRSIKLLEHGMKIVERIFEKRLRKVVDLDEMQMGFRPGRGTVDAIFIMRQMMEKYEIAGKKLYMVFVDLEKAFDRVPRELIWWALRRKGVMEREIMAIKEMYSDIKTSVRVECERSESFDVKVGVHQGSVLSPLLFAVVMDEVTKDVREGVVKEILYADDLVLLGDSWKEVESRYTRWKNSIERERFEN